MSSSSQQRVDGFTCSAAMPYSRSEFMLHSVFAIFLLFVDSLVDTFWRVISFGSGGYCGNDANWCKQLAPNLASHVVVVTGANVGIGRATATELAKRGATVILACRDIQKGMEASLEINSQLQKIVTNSTSSKFGGGDVDYPYARYGRSQFMRLDLSDLHSVLEFSSKIRQEFQRIDILVNNAGLNVKGVLPNGVQQLFQVNYLGHYMLFRTLEDLLRSKVDNLGIKPDSTGNNTDGSNTTGATASTAPAEARVVNLSSVMHHTGQPDYEACATSKYKPFMRGKYSYYGDSKLYMNYLTLEINRRYDFERKYQISDGEGVDEEEENSSVWKDSLPGRPIVAVSANPGAVRSEIWRDYSMKWLWNIVMNLLFLDVKEGCATSVYGASVDISVIRRFQDEWKHSQSTGGRMQKRSDVPYFVPYKVHSSLLACEIFGRFRGVRFAGVTFPGNIQSQQLLGTTPVAQAKKLWDYSAELCRKVLLHSGSNIEEVSFLQ